MKDLEFSQIYKTLWPKVYNFIYYRIQNAEEAEELTQEVFHKVYRQVKYDKVKDSKLKSYIYTAARNLIYDKWRRKSKTPKIFTLEGLREKGLEIEDKKQVIEEKLAIEEALELLSPEDRTVIVLRIIEGYSIKDVAEKLGRPPGTIKVLQYRALQKLRNLLKIGGFFNE